MYANGEIDSEAEIIRDASVATDEQWNYCFLSKYFSRISRFFFSFARRRRSTGERIIVRVLIKIQLVVISRDAGNIAKCSREGFPREAINLHPNRGNRYFHRAMAHLQSKQIILFLSLYEYLVLTLIL